MLVADFFVILQPIKVLLTQKVKNIMGGFFGTISTKDCVNDLFYGTDYNSHLGTKRAGLVTFDEESGFHRSIHSLERNYFRSRFEDELDEFKGHQGLGVISDTDPQPIIVNSHLGRYAVVTVAKINNLREIAEVAKANGYKLRLRGSCDSATATPAYNQTLSENRCNKIKSELMELGIPADQIIIEPIGGVKQLDPTEYDRRVLIQLVKEAE
jgi:glutamine phosphoribosylpyrophosphate amidotransferase